MSIRRFASVPRLALVFTGTMLVACGADSASSPDHGEVKWSLSTGDAIRTVASNADVNVSATADDENFVYWATLTTIYRTAKQGGKPVALHSSSGAISAEGLAVDEQYLYFPTLEGTVFRIPKAGGVAEPIAKDQPRAWGIAVDDARVYWTRESADGKDLTSGKIVSFNKKTHELRVLADGEHAPMSLRLAGGYLYWGAHYEGPDTIRRIQVEGGKPEELAESFYGFNISREFGIAGDDLVFCESNTHNDVHVVHVNVGTGSRLDMIPAPVAYDCRVAAGRDGSMWVAAHVQGERQNAELILRARTDKNTLSGYAKRSYPVDHSTLGVTGLIVDTNSLYWADFDWGYDGKMTGSVIAAPIPTLRD